MNKKLMIKKSLLVELIQLSHFIGRMLHMDDRHH